MDIKTLTNQRLLLQGRFPILCTQSKSYRDLFPSLHSVLLSKTNFFKQNLFWSCRQVYPKAHQTLSCRDIYHIVPHSHSLCMECLPYSLTSSTLVKINNLLYIQFYFCENSYKSASLQIKFDKMLIHVYTLLWWNYVFPHYGGETYCFWPVNVSITKFVSATPPKLLIRISWNLVCS